MPLNKETNKPNLSYSLMIHNAIQDLCELTSNSNEVGISHSPEVHRISPPVRFSVMSRTLLFFRGFTPQ